MKKKERVKLRRKLFAFFDNSLEEVKAGNTPLSLDELRPIPIELIEIHFEMWNLKRSEKFAREDELC